MYKRPDWHVRMSGRKIWKRQDHRVAPTMLGQMKNENKTKVIEKGDKERWVRKSRGVTIVTEQLITEIDAQLGTPFIIDARIENIGLG